MDKARDTRLDRFVAIKTAKEKFSDRFQREAKAIAALNHPYICILYDIGPNYLVMEYVEGRRCAARCRLKSGYAHHFLHMAVGGIQPAHEAMPRVREHAQAALDLDPSLAEAHGLLATVAALYDYDWGESERRFRLTLDCDAVPPLVRGWYGFWLLQLIGRAGEGIPEQERALREDPLNFVVRFALGSSKVMGGNFTEGDAQLRQSVELAEGA